LYTAQEKHCHSALIVYRKRFKVRAYSVITTNERTNENKERRQNIAFAATIRCLCRVFSTATIISCIRLKHMDFRICTWLSCSDLLPRLFVVLRPPHNV